MEAGKLMQDLINKIDGKTATLVAATVAALGVVGMAASAYGASQGRAAVARKCAKARARRDDNLTADIKAINAKAAEIGLTGARRAEIIGLTASQLADELRRGDISAVEAVLSYAHRVVSYVMPATNAVTDTCFRRAIKDAEKADELLMKARSKTAKAPSTGSSASGSDSDLPPMLGVPVSLKEHMDYKNTMSAAGLGGLSDHVAEEDGLFAQQVRAAGAIPIAKTTLPQAMMVPESSNQIFGVCGNAWDPARSPGGSSGGEGAMVGARGTPLGYGGDVGGSLRSPAAYNGLVTIKPVFQRVTKQGFTKPFGPPFADEKGRSFAGREIIQFVGGPIARTVADARLGFACLASPPPALQDPILPYRPFRWDAGLYNGRDAGAADDVGAGSSAGGAAAGKKSEGSLRFVTMTDDGFFRPAQSVMDAVSYSAAMLKAQGHEQLEASSVFPESIFREAALLFVSIMSSEGNMQLFKSGLRGEAFSPLYSGLVMVASIPAWLRPPIAWALETVLGQGRKASLLRASKPKSVKELLIAHGRLQLLRQDVVRCMEKAKVHFILCPVAAVPAFPHGGSKQLAMGMSYQFMFNALNLPSVVLPCGRIRAGPKGSGAEPGYTGGLGQHDEYAAGVRACMEGSEGLPLAVQMVGYPWREEELLNAAEVAEGVFPDPGMPADLELGISEAAEAKGGGKGRGAAGAAAIAGEPGRVLPSVHLEGFEGLPKPGNVSEVLRAGHVPAPEPMGRSPRVPRKAGAGSVKAPTGGCFAPVGSS